MATCVDNNVYNEKWEYTPFKQIKNVANNICLDVNDLNPQDYVFAQECNTDSETQKWIIEAN